MYDEARKRAHKKWYAKNKDAYNVKLRLKRLQDPQREEKLAKRREEYHRNRDAYLRRLRAYKATPEGARVNKSSWLKQRYGITLDQWEAMAASQGNVCAICRKRPIKHTDHCHTTGKIRGLLCHGCNVGLGSFREEVDTMEQAIAYLKKQHLQVAA